MKNVTTVMEALEATRIQSRATCYVQKRKEAEKIAARATAADHLFSREQMHPKMCKWESLAGALAAPVKTILVSTQGCPLSTNGFDLRYAPKAALLLQNLIAVMLHHHLILRHHLHPTILVALMTAQIGLHFSPPNRRHGGRDECGSEC